MYPLDNFIKSIPEFTKSRIKNFVREFRNTPFEVYEEDGRWNIQAVSQKRSIGLDKTEDFDETCFTIESQLLAFIQSLQPTKQVLYDYSLEELASEDGYCDAEEDEADAVKLCPHASKLIAWKEFGETLQGEDLGLSLQRAYNEGYFLGIRQGF